MSTREQVLQQDIRAQLGRNPKLRIFRNNVGKAIPVGRGHKRPVDYGLCQGSSDLIGFRAVEVTPEMVGTVVAQFIAIEVKTPEGRVSEGQGTFLRMVEELGGLAMVARSLNDVEGLME